MSVFNCLVSRKEKGIRMGYDAKETYSNMEKNMFRGCTRDESSKYGEVRFPCMEPDTRSCCCQP